MMENDDGRQSLAIDMAEPESRRGLLKKAVGVGAAATLGSIAGCTGGDSGDGGDGDGSGGGDGGDGGSDGGGGDGGTVRLLMSPDGIMGIIFTQFHEETDTLTQYFDEVGVSLEVEETYEGAAVFTAGGADFESFGTFEAAMIGAERGIPLASHANIVPVFLGGYTYQGSPYDPEEHDGDLQSVFDTLNENQDPVTVNAWGGGDIPATIIVFDEYGYVLSQEAGESDVPTQTTQYYTMAQLFEDETLVWGTNSPEHGLAPYMMTDDTNIARIYQIGQALSDLGLGVPQLNSWTCTQEFSDTNSEVVEALVQSYQEGSDWFYSDPAEIIGSNEDYMDMLGMTSQEAVEFLVDWGLELDDPNGFENDLPIQYEDHYLSDEFIESDREFIARVEETGFIDGEWQDHFEYRQVSTDYGDGHYDG